MPRMTGKLNPAYIHGNANKTKRSREYSIWSAMKTRCTNPRQTTWKRYGGRGISVCERWQRFENFLADMGSAPSPKHCIDRIDNDGNYEPSNCRWATYKQQSHNSSAVKYVSVHGKIMILKEAAVALGVDRTLLTKRIAMGMTAQEAVDKPIDRKKSDGVRRAWKERNTTWEK